MIKKLIATLALLAASAFGQTHTFPAEDTNNTFTGTNTFNSGVLVNFGSSYGIVYPACAELATQNEFVEIHVENGVSCAITASVSSTKLYGICVGQCGTSQAQIAITGAPLLVLDGQSTPGDLVQASPTSAGQGIDQGAGPLSSGQTFARVIDANSGAGTASHVSLNPGDVNSPGTSNTGTIANSPQYQVPYYSNTGSSNVLSGFSACTVNTSTGQLTCTLLGTNGPGPGEVTFGNGTLPSTPISGNSVVSTNTNNGMLTCLNSASSTNPAATDCLRTDIDVRLGYGNSGGVDCTGTNDSTAILQAMVNNAPDFSRFVFPANCKVLVSTTSGSPKAITIQSRYGLEFWFEGREANGCDTGGTGPGGAAIFDNSSYVSGAAIFYINQSQRLLFHNPTLRLNGAVDVGFDVDQTTSPPITTANTWENACIQNNVARNSAFRGWRFSNTATLNVEAQKILNSYVQCSSQGISGQSYTNSGYAVFFGNNNNQKTEVVDGLGTFGCSQDEVFGPGSDFTATNFLMSQSYSNILDGAFNSLVMGMRSENSTHSINVTNPTGPHTYIHNDFAAANGSPIDCTQGSPTTGCGFITAIGNEADSDIDILNPAPTGQNTEGVLIGNRHLTYNQFEWEGGLFAINSKGFNPIFNSFGEYLSPSVKPSAISQNFASPPLVLESAYGSTPLFDTYLIQNMPNGNYGSISNSTIEIGRVVPGQFGGGANWPGGIGAGGVSLTQWLAFPGNQSGLTLAQAPQPGAPTLDVLGTPGSTCYTYLVVAHGNTGSTQAGTSTQTCAGPSTLNGTNSIQVSAPSVAGATYYDIYRTQCAGSGICSTNPTGIIGQLAGVVYVNPLQSGASEINLTDTGLSAGGQTAPTTNTTGTLAGSVINTPASFTIYPATDSTCTVYSFTGTQYCASSNISGARFTSTDLRALWDSVLTAAPNGGTFFFKNGTYNCNTLDQESTGGFSNYYCLGIPGNVSTNQYATWTIEGEGLAPVVGSSPVQTTGTIIALTATAVSSVAAHSKIILVWSRPPTGTGAFGPEVFESNLLLRVPTNQRGCETESDLSEAVNSGYVNVTGDTAVQPSSLAIPFEDTCTAWGATDPGGLIGLTTNNSSENVAYFNNVNVWGGDVCIDIRTEHSVLDNTYGNSCNHAIDYGVRGGNLYHASSWRSSGWQESLRGLTIGSLVTQGSTLDISGLDIEDASASATFAPVYHAQETNAGYVFGRISYTVVLSGSGVMHQAGIFDGGGGTNIQLLGYGSSIVPPSPLAVDTFHRPNSTTIGTFWLMNGGNNNIGITSNTAELATSGAQSGRARYIGEVFQNDQFTQATFSTMDTNAATYAQVETNQQTALAGSSQQEYNYFCSRSAGAGQYGFGKFTGGSQTNFATSSTATCPTPPFTLEIRHIGTLICAFLNGALDPNLTPNCAVDSSISGGAPSFYLAQDTTGGVAVSNFLAGSFPPLHGITDSIYSQTGTWSGLQSFTTTGTTTNCKAIGTAANPSVAACGASAAGTVSCSTTASTGTCTVSTTAVTANSQILVHQRADTTTGTRLGVTCNTTKDTNSTDPQITAVTAGTSFTFQLGTINTNPECFSYSIIN